MRAAAVLLFLAYVLPAADSTAEAVSAAEARSVAGRQATIRGTVTQLGQIPAGAGPLVLELDGEPRATVFRVIVPPNLLPAFGENPRRRFRDKEITVTGQVALYRNVPQIVVSDVSQIAVKDEPAGSEETAPPKPGANERPKPAAASRGSGENHPQNLLKNPDFAGGTKYWKLPKSAVVEDGVLRIRLDPKKSVRVQQTFSEIPNDAIQFQAFFRAQLAVGSSLAKPLMLRMGPSLREASSLARPFDAKPGEWTEIKWTRTSDLKGFSKMTIYIDAGPGEGELLIDDAVLFAHPDWKDKRTWKVSDG